MRVLVTGACGLLGSHLMVVFQSRGDELLGLDRNPWWGDRPVPCAALDLLDSSAVRRTVSDFKPELLLHCAALADVDRCEKDPGLAERYNLGMTRTLAETLPAGTRMVYLSTDGVFQGERPFTREEWPAAPKTVYGRTKLQGEQVVVELCAHPLIVRTNFYGWSSGRKKTSAEWLYRALKERQPVTLFEDFYFTPLYVVDFVNALLRLIDGGPPGLFHIGGRERVSKYEFGRQMAQAAGFPFASVGRGSIDRAGLAAPRPKDMSLDTAKFQTATGTTLPGCEEGIRRFLAHREVPLSRRFPLYAEGKTIPCRWILP